MIGLPSRQAMLSSLSVKGVITKTLSVIRSAPLTLLVSIEYIMCDVILHANTFLRVN